MRFASLLVTPVVACALACSSSSPGITDPHRVETDLVGTWSQVVTGTQVERVIELTVSDTVVTGVGHWSGEAIVGGSITVTGQISGSNVELQLVQDDNTILQFSGHLASKNSLVGGFMGVDHAEPAQFQRVGVDPP